MQKMRALLGRAKNEAGELAEKGMLKVEINGLNRRRDAALRAMGARVYERHERGAPLAGFEADCEEVRRLDDLIAEKKAELSQRPAAARAPADSPAAG